MPLKGVLGQGVEGFFGNAQPAREVAVKDQPEPSLDMAALPTPVTSDRAKRIFRSDRGVEATSEVGNEPVSTVPRCVVNRFAFGGGDVDDRIITRVVVGIESKCSEGVSNRRRHDAGLIPCR